MKTPPEVLGLQGGWTFVMQQGALLALLPIEDWIRGLELTDTTAPILDPTAYRDYLYSGKGEVIKDVLRAALVFKRAILAAQEKVKSDPRLSEVKPQYAAGGAR